MKMRLLMLVTCLLSSVSLYGWDSYDAGDYYCLEDCSARRGYVGGFGGANWMKDLKSNGGFLDTHLKTGYALGVFAGCQLSNHLRVEGELSYRNNAVKNVKVDGARTGAKGHDEVIAYLVNVLYDFECNSLFTPYIGLGLGGARENRTTSVNGSANSGHVSFKNRDNDFIWQAIAGMSRTIYCKTDLGLEYRYLAGKNDNIAHALLLSLRRYF